MMNSHRWAQGLGGALLVLLLLPAARHAAESSMTMHMLVQYSGLMLAGALLACIDVRVRHWHRVAQRWNELGIAGLTSSGIALAVLMVPRILDLALVDGRVEAAKLLTLVLVGAALRVSWRPAGSVVQAFFLGNVLPMMAVVGTLYQDSTTRVCNAYLLDDQRTLGAGLVWLAIGIAAAWLLRLGLVHRRRPSAAA
jgi:hypothetical protein